MLMRQGTGRAEQGRLADPRGTINDDDPADARASRGQGITQARQLAITLEQRA
jgi:hypothetical protein